MSLAATLLLASRMSAGAGAKKPAIFPIHGVVVQATKSVMRLRTDAVPGIMPAQTRPYPVPVKLSPRGGGEIDALLDTASRPPRLLYAQLRERVRADADYGPAANFRWPDVAGGTFELASQAAVLRQYHVYVDPRKAGKDRVRSSLVYVIDDRLRQADLLALGVNLIRRSTSLSPMPRGGNRFASGHGRRRTLSERRADKLS